MPQDTPLAMTELEARVAIAQATKDYWADRPFDPGKADCARMVRWHARAMGCPVTGTAKANNYRSLIGMKRSLARLGAKTVGDLAAQQPGWIEISAASAWPGDIVELGDEADGGIGIGALAIVLTNGRALAFAGELSDQRCAVGQPSEYGRAWRLPCVPAKSAVLNG